MKIVKKMRLYSQTSVCFLVVILLVFSMLFFQGCSSANAPGDSASEGIVENGQVPVHDLDMNAEPLSTEDKMLSPEGYGAVGALADQELTVRDMLAYAVEDEYLAHGEYLAITDKFGAQNPYTNIIKSEETHLSLLEQIYSVYDFDFPEDTSTGHIVIPETLLEAAETGVQAEINNIAMYDRFLSYDLPDNIADVFTSLRNGSESHLLAFKKQVDKLSD